MALETKKSYCRFCHAFSSEIVAAGASTNRLVSNSHNTEPITGMARQSAIPVKIRRVAGL